jgi:hypothetical protein
MTCTCMCPNMCPKAPALAQKPRAVLGLVGKAACTRSAERCAPVAAGRPRPSLVTPVLVQWCAGASVAFRTRDERRTGGAGAPATSSGAGARTG